MNQVTFGQNKFCGPSVMSAICGITTDEAESIIKSITCQKGRVTGVYEKDLRAAFESIGYKTDKITFVGRSVFAALFHINYTYGNGFFVFTVPGHYIAVELNGNHRYICDNHSKEPINASASSRLGQKAVSVFRVVKK